MVPKIVHPVNLAAPPIRKSPKSHSLASCGCDSFTCYTESDGDPDREFVDRQELAKRFMESEKCRGTK